MNITKSIRLMEHSNMLNISISFIDTCWYWTWNFMTVNTKSQQRVPILLQFKAHSHSHIKLSSHQHLGLHVRLCKVYMLMKWDMKQWCNISFCVCMYKLDFISCHYVFFNADSILAEQLTTRVSLRCQYCGSKCLNSRLHLTSNSIFSSVKF